MFEQRNFGRALTRDRKTLMFGGSLDRCTCWGFAIGVTVVAQTRLARAHAFFDFGGWPTIS
jgi:hypothetical protein